jgi:Tol biopolymer transport system component
MLYFSSGKKQKKLMILKIIVSALVILFFIFSSTSCTVASKIIKAALAANSGSSSTDNKASGEDGNSNEQTQSPGQNDNSENLGSEDSKEVSESTESMSPESSESGGLRLVYVEITSDPNSNHFEHRVENIYSVAVDGSYRELIFSDINEKYDLGPVFSISPDGKKIACKFVEGARGVYSSLAVIDIPSKSITLLEEFDYIDHEEDINVLDLYGNPLWTSDSRFLIYQRVKDQHTSNTRDAGMYKADVQTGQKTEIWLDVMGASLRSTLMLAPAFLYDDEKKIGAVFHPYYPVDEDGEITGFYTTNEGMSAIDIESGKVEDLFLTSVFEGKEGTPEIFSSFDNLFYLSGIGKMIFQLLGDFEEDGDLWISDIFASSPVRLTEDNNLREQQPTVYGADSSNPLIAYLGSKRYGTISSQIPSGNIFLIDSKGEQQKKLTSYDVGAFKPVFSPDGKKIGFLRAIYDKNFEYITQYLVESVDIESGNISVAASGGYLDLVGWITK